MTKWWEFFKERTPVASYVLMTAGPVASGYFLGGRTEGRYTVYSFLGLFLFFIVLRMMDEFKDYEKDVLAHPSRPLPRGLIPLKEFHRGILGGVGLMLALFIFLGVMGMKAPAFFYGLVILHLWLMYKEFYVGEWLNQYPLLYASSHQVILLTLCFFCLSFFKGATFSRLDLVYALSVLFAFFSYEVCRKLDPSAHPVLKTYRLVYGLKGVLMIVTTLVSLHIVSLLYFFQPGLRHFYFFILPMILLGALVGLIGNRLKFKSVEAIATVNLLFFLYSGLFYALSL